MDISQDLKIRDIIGEEKYILLMKNFGGSNLYIEKYETHQRNERNQKIKKLSPHLKVGIFFCLYP